MEGNGDTAPFWAQGTTSPRRRSSKMVSLPMLVIGLSVLLLIVLLFLLPPFLSQILRPYTVKRSLDSFNILLVLFAILCGVFARRNDDGSSVSKASDERPVVQQPWFDEYGSNRNSSPIRPSPVTGVSRLRRSSSSYPDLRQESLWEVHPRDDRFRFSDDFEINRYHSPEYGRLRRTRTEIGDEKVIPVDTFVNRCSTPPPPPSKSPPATPPPPPVVRRKTRRTYQSVGRRENPDAASKTEAERENNRSPAPAAPPPPPPPPAVLKATNSDQKQGKLERRKSSAKKEIAMVWASLYKQGKRGKKKHKEKNVREADFDSPPVDPHFSTTIPPPSPAPPPPPPPPPPSVFHSLFKKGTNKSKKIHSVPPPPPPPPPSTRRTQTQISPPPPPTPPKSSRRRNSSTSGRPPLPTKTSSYYYDRDENLNSGGQSPLIPPPPPPPPPFRRNQSSRCSSPEPEDGEYARDGGDATRSGFCPSPDVNFKADSFIARLREEWRLEKINSLREKNTNMGPNPSPGPRTSI